MSRQPSQARPPTDEDDEMWLSFLDLLEVLAGVSGAQIVGRGRPMDALEYMNRERELVRSEEQCWKHALTDIRASAQNLYHVAHRRQLDQRPTATQTTTMALVEDLLKVYNTDIPLYSACGRYRNFLLYHCRHHLLVADACDTVPIVAALQLAQRKFYETYLREMNKMLVRELSYEMLEENFLSRVFRPNPDKIDYSAAEFYEKQEMVMHDLAYASYHMYAQWCFKYQQRAMVFLVTPVDQDYVYGAVKVEGLKSILKGVGFADENISYSLIREEVAPCGAVEIMVQVKYISEPWKDAEHKFGQPKKYL
jgi:hypothetical protein